MVNLEVNPYFNIDYNFNRTFYQDDLLLDHFMNEEPEVKQEISKIKETVQNELPKEQYFKGIRENEHKFQEFIDKYDQDVKKFYFKYKGIVNLQNDRK